MNTSAAISAQDAGGTDPSAEEIRLASRDLGGGLYQTELSIPGMHCGGCMRKIERALADLGNVDTARVNLTAKRAAATWRAENGRPPPLIEALGKLGYEATLCDSGAEQSDDTLKQMIRSLAVAGFGLGNIMLLSVSVWAGAEPQMRDLFHWLSAAIALPVLVYSGRIFFVSAWRAVRHGHTNMDVPICIGVLLAYALSLYDTAQSHQHVYFDASVALLFVLLIGRTLDHLMREKARSALTGLERLGARGATVIRENRTRIYLPVDDIQPGMTILLAAGERVPVDAVVLSGESELDCALVTGESQPQPAAPDTQLQAGTLNLAAPLTIRASAAARDSFLSEMVHLIEAVEAGRPQYRRVIDRAAALYAPVVHLLALVSFAGWVLIDGDIHNALTIAIAVLIITCPCALGLAAPIVQVVAARRLFEEGVIVKDGAALERLNDIDTVIFDKTGTLTLGTPALRRPEATPSRHARLAVSLAGYSSHPYSRAIVRAFSHIPVLERSFAQVRECPGLGIEAQTDDGLIRLGRASWAAPDMTPSGGGRAFPCTVLSRAGVPLEIFEFDDPLRPDAAAAVSALRDSGVPVEICSGDTRPAVEAVARAVGVTAVSAGVMPAEKADRIAALARAGRKTLMVGDGLNDAPALAAAHVSMAPSTGADIGRNAADVIFLHRGLNAVPAAITIARRAARLVNGNLMLAVLYNAAVLPFAVLGYVTPLLAALAMSSSSILVVANALRLNDRRNVKNYGTAPGVEETFQGQAKEATG